MIVKEIVSQFASNTLGNGCVIFRCNFDVAQYSDTQFFYYNVPFHNSLINAVPKRRAEFLAGRYCAQQALLKLGIHNTFVGVGKNRNPIWPTDIVGSISHDKDNAIAIVKPETSQNSIIGVDIERWIGKDELQDMRKMIINEEEYWLLMKAGLDTTQAITLGFSAKESFFKAAYKIVNEYFGFEEAQITAIHRSAHGGFLKLNISDSLKTKLPSRTEFKVSFFFESERVLTICNH
uniref:Enterobactin synthase component D n=1 Tax=Rheinheimera sp. BAL341 TaxID=1708203 RepID=A0A486XLU9_9GAMM